MTTNEMRDLDAWICLNLFNWTQADVEKRPAMMPHFTTDPAAAMEVLKWVIQESNIVFGRSINLETSGSAYWIDVRIGVDDLINAHALSLELAICLFAKRLFEKGNE